MLLSYQKRVINTLNKFKGTDAWAPLQCLPIYNFQMTILGYLRPITHNHSLTLPNCPELLARWRNENAHMSPEQFVATAESTEKWLNDLILARDDRILFLIIANDGTKVGHIGLAAFDFKKKSCEIDAVVRGVKTGYQGMMTFALNSLISWGLTELKLKQVLLRVLSDNLKAIAFYSRNSFVKVKDIPFNPAAKQYYTQMQLDVKKWKRQNSRYPAK